MSIHRVGATQGDGMDILPSRRRDAVDIVMSTVSRRRGAVLICKVETREFELQSHFEVRGLRGLRLLAQEPAAPQQHGAALAKSQRTFTDFEFDDIVQIIVRCLDYGVFQ